MNLTIQLGESEFKCVYLIPLVWKTYTLLVHITRTHYSCTLFVRITSYTMRTFYKHYTYTKYPYLCVFDSINRYKWAIQTCVKIKCTGSVNTSIHILFEETSRLISNATTEGF